LQKDNGGAYIWQSNGTAVTRSSSLGNPGPSWHIKAEGDFYGNGNPNILRQNVDGAAHIWGTNGTNVIASASLANLGPLGMSDPRSHSGWAPRRSGTARGPAEP
jgi:hypothetical protein